MVRTVMVTHGAFVLLIHLACGAVPQIPSLSMFTASNFVKYINSTTNFSVSGTVNVTMGNSMVPSQLVSWDLAGIDPACNGGEAGNRCGIHIHEGKSCTEGAGGHFFKVAQDPWVADINGSGGVYYIAAKVNTSTSGMAGIHKSTLMSAVEVNTNLTASDIQGRAVIVHDSTSPGRRIACALLAASIPATTTTTTTTSTAATTTTTTMSTTTTATTTTGMPMPIQFAATSFMKYVNSTTNFSVSGTVKVTMGSSMVPSQLVSWDLAGIDPACEGGQAGNRCGIHIHEGKSCTEGAGGHFFKVAEDPWVAGINGSGGVYYTASNMNASTSSMPAVIGSTSMSDVEVITNLTATDILGRAIIVHDSTPPGRRIACALLNAVEPHRTTTTASGFLSGSSAVGASIFGLLMAAVVIV